MSRFVQGTHILGELKFNVNYESNSSMFYQNKYFTMNKFHKMVQALCGIKCYKLCNPTFRIENTFYLLYVCFHLLRIHVNTYSVLPTFSHIAGFEKVRNEFRKLFLFQFFVLCFNLINT